MSTASAKQFRLLQDRGASSIEYAILGSLIAAVIVLVVTTLGTQVLALFQTVSW
mgnify:FL=1